ncbi:arginine--tRNA ligase [Helicobacter sp. 13S00401-1]|uniref:arginine--tRNA ligase n=1 Tax=Helicobacter sp. 13S00401-1 TaxID=1905758 RepID=UPI000BA7246A|nr:arginine--tRNA ligase [Helicobacter sp. 13S00401-1]PAF51431.1 arginine--tRNA ligase [Helicobacter sp. 13S00401-1]
MYFEVKKYLSARLEDIFEQDGIDISSLLILEQPKDSSLGHFATPICFSLAKLKRTNPKVLATELASKLENSQVFSKVEALNGYLNFTLDTKYLESFLNTPPKLPALESKKILLEFVSANPTGPLHIGHARGAIVGNAIANIAKKLHQDFFKEYYVNDAGSQIENLAKSIYAAICEIKGLPCEVSEDKLYKGEYINELALKALNTLSLDSIPLVKDAGFKDFLTRLGEFGKELMLEEIKANLKSLNIEFDSYMSEKELFSKWNETFKALEKAKALKEEEGSIWLCSSLKGDEKDRVLIRSNKEPTYMVGDIIYHKNKFDRGFDTCINIWGADHHGYLARIKAALEFLGVDSQRLKVLFVQMVSVLKDSKPYKMSKRAGNFILLQDVVDEIGADNLKFIFLSKSLDTHLEFDIAEIIRTKEESPLYYINYANARIHTILARSTLDKDSILTSSLQTDNANLESDYKLLCLTSLNLNHILLQCFNDNAPHKLCDYLKNLSKQFHSFYNAYKILGSKEEASILKLFLNISNTLTIGFDLLGLNIKTSM